MEPYTIDPAKQWSNTIRILHKFDAYRVAYKYVDSQPIHAFFVIPKQLPPGPRPLLVRFHGGGWTEGEADASLRPFFLELALKHGAIVLTPDYRLRPEHEMTDGLDDVRSFWKWVEQEAQQVLRQAILGLELDARNLLVGGESAGGYYTAQTAMLRMTQLPIKVLFIQYPGIDLGKLLNIPENRTLEEIKLDYRLTPPLPYSLIEEHLAGLEPGKICTRAKFGTRMDLHRAMIQAGKFCDISGDRAWIDPMSSVETAPKMPPILLVHSKEDEAVSWEYSEAWAEKLQRLQPDVPMHLSWQTGHHVFDRDHNMETPWLKEPLEFVQKYWPVPANIVPVSA
ncbi:uncharacterized protein A1O9_11947 [Exophiala aquamarina CBS 119918]|uniref:Alpha/beta hydrolase fold-3 domain-containing protein n=1 Tax=Exophiala aquamarina CBS 119918 TaxID=1182545 RepID=A0A072NX05_9EURO|nr:uncharacterized protein A1O9_11947 [Exophiala aquamarina CBS 119918]KEF51957.1 hypothetical protein A1O9_11947 [Exophiala aquamarina CBS 119918]